MCFEYLTYEVPSLTCKLLTTNCSRFLLECPGSKNPLFSWRFEANCAILARKQTLPTQNFTNSSWPSGLEGYEKMGSGTKGKIYDAPESHGLETHYSTVFVISF